jgi:hypothetical protein
MAKPNYAFEKRQRDLAKKKKKEEKAVEKRMRKAGATDGSPAAEGAEVAAPATDAANDTPGPDGTAPAA